MIFLDDLQWADSASLNLLSLLMQDAEYLLILGAYRDNEVSPVHPFILTVDEVIKTGATVNTITLPPLSETDLNRLVADTLNCESSRAQPLTKLVYQKTKENPFFATQLLKALNDDKLITFDWEIRYWQCDISQVNALSITDDVVDFMAVQLQKLPIETQDIIKLAACIGAQFDLNTLAIVSEKLPGSTATALWKALQEGLVIPTTKIYKFFTQSDSEEVLKASANPIYRFLHDRVQQAAYSLIPADRKQATHLQSGQLLQQNLSEIEKEEKLFDIVGHFNLGIDLITEAKEREELARLNLAAGQKARSFVQTGLDLLTANCWQTQYALTLNLYVAATETAYLNADFEGMEAMAAEVLQKAQTILDKVKIYEIQINALAAQSRMLAAIANEPDLLIGTAYDEKLMIPKHHQDNELTALGFVYIYKLMLAYFFGNYNNAVDYITQANLYLMSIAGLIQIRVFHFYAGLTYLAVFFTQSEIEQANTLALVETHQNTLVQWAHHAPMNHQHKVDLVEAEKCRVLGQKSEAMELYDQAIFGAKENEYIQQEALANELAAKCYLAWGKEKVAASYMQEAYYCYSRWGAKAKASI